MKGPVPSSIEFYFSYRSPYAWLASRRLPALIEHLPVTIEYCPVWEPEPELRETLARAGLPWTFPPPTSRKRRYIFRDVRRHVASYGYRMRWPVDREPRWSLPHLGLLHARRESRGEIYHQRLFDARFEEGLDITSPEQVARVLEQSGVSAARFLERVDAGGFVDEILECYRRADAAGVVGWPFFRWGKDVFWGNDRVSWLVRAIEEQTGLRCEREPSQGAADEPS